MIRFCDKEIVCLQIEELNRRELFSYFLNGHRDDMVCVMDQEGNYKGNITYTSLLLSNEIEESIQTEKVVLDQNVWENGRNFFKNYKRFGNEIVLLPIVDHDGVLLSFAYQDEDANREIRELCEIMQCKNALDFHDVFPKYDCVTIWGCNELAYYFALYLIDSGLHVNVRGDFWNKLGLWEVHECLDYRNLNIYAEGTWSRCENLREYLLRSVSVEFECIDIIYERNIKEGVIRDKLFKFDELMVKLKKSELIVIKGIGWESLSACDLLLKNGIENICFLSDEEIEGRRLIAGKPVYNLKYICKKYQDIVFIDCCSEHSMWGSGEVDYYNYIGYKRNERYFCIKDYVDIMHNDLHSLLQGQNVVLIGDPILCKKVYLYYNFETKCLNMAYYNILDDKKAEDYIDEMPVVKKNNINCTNFYLIILSEFTYNKKKKRQNKITSETYIKCLRQEEYYNYTIMYNQTVNNIIMQDQKWNSLCNCKIKYSNYCLKPKAIVLGSMLGGCGNIVLRNMLNGYDRIIKMDYGFLNENLVLFCTKLAGEKASDILNLFWKIVKENLYEESIETEFHSVNLFNKKMFELLQVVGKPTSQELFIIFHLAHAAMNGKDISDASNYIVYWERHGVYRAIYPDCTGWLAEEGIRGLVVTNSRNCVVRAGGLIRFLKTKNFFNRTDTLLFRMVLDEPSEWDVNESVWDEIEIKFEELKCNPQKIMDEIAGKLDINLSNNPDKTMYSEPVKYEDMEQHMKPVYNMYEEFLSAFDRMRIALLTSNWQKKRGYPYIDSKDITSKEMQEMFLREFRFEKQLVFSSDEEYLMYRQGRQRWLRQRFSSLRLNKIL